jgi:hypothetical protein
MKLGLLEDVEEVKVDFAAKEVFVAVVPVASGRKQLHPRDVLSAIETIDPHLEPVLRE